MKTSTPVRILCLLAIFLQVSSLSFSQAAPQEKDFVLEVVERNREAIALLGDSIFYFAELGMQEIESSKLMTEILEEKGFTIERALSGMPPAYGGLWFR